MKFKILVFVLLVWICQVVRAQQDPALNQVFVEAWGLGGYGSINYERIYYCINDWMFGMRAGLGSYRLRDYTNAFNPDLLLPFTMNMLYGGLHKIECGIGGTIARIVQADSEMFRPVRKTHYHPALTIGYRYQKTAGGLVFRGNYIPILERGRHFRHWAGISIGYSF
ncbi:MAG TPA: hypothetical protein VFX48_00290, partial [Saprospiraceae bacterium]|nr:hypothetical protein [Saprospiraceae bacterium]